ncbi:hypothetical protein [Haloferax mucosum]|nr:hypothetical protein [Haloferax mucosum]
MEANLLGYDDEDCGFEVFDENNNRHVISVEWDGSIGQHATKDYPLKREDRTQEEQRIMSQVEVRARYAAQQEFPDADILLPMWDIEHLEAGLEALVNYPLDEFHREFRDFYEALRDPGQFITDSDFDPEMVKAFKIYRFRDGEILDISPVLVRHLTGGNTADDYGPKPDYPEDELISCCLPNMEFVDYFDYETQMQDLVVGHVVAQIRDLYLHMGEMPPEEYQVEGIGKLDINGDGIGDN